ncbi:PIN domain nuclease [Stackebrandtia albiflava]|uniref:PIN domain nuclease n=1 Tax=Stackebrandtia albiflava TaxID=406432 RepID=UPI001B85F2C3|nr:PIN domain nuclease [Stackebrandtia albiflava]
MTRYLADKSALARLHLEPVRERLEPLITRGLVSVCAATEYELLYSAKNLQDYDRIREVLLPAFPWASMGDDPWEAALRIRRGLAEHGRHRAASMVDLLLSVVAMQEGLILLHYDKDFDTIAAVTGQKTEWVVPPGTV